MSDNTRLIVLIVHNFEIIEKSEGTNCEFIGLIGGNAKNINKKVPRVKCPISEVVTRPECGDKIVHDKEINTPKHFFFSFKNRYVRSQEN